MNKQDTTKETDTNTAIAISADGYTVATGYRSGKIQIWDLKTEKELLTFTAHREEISCLLFSQDNKILFSGSTDKRIKLWDPFKGVKIKSFRAHRGKVTTLALNDEGTLLASGSSDKKIRIWDITQNLKKIHELKKHKDVVSKVLFSPKGKTIITSSWDHSILIWYYESNAIKSELKGHFGAVYDLALSSDGKKLLSCSSDGILRFWHLKRNKSSQITVRKAGLTVVAIHPNDKIAVTGNSKGEITFWDLQNKNEIKSWKAHEENIIDIEFSKNGKILLSLSMDQTVKIWNFNKLLEEKEERFFVKLKSAVTEGGLKELVKGIWQKAIMPIQDHSLKTEAEKLQEIKQELPLLLSSVANGEEVYVKDIQQRFITNKFVVEKAIIELLKERKLIGKFNPFTGILVIDRRKPSELIDSEMGDLDEIGINTTCFYCGYPLTENVLSCPNCKKEVEKCPICKLHLNFADKIGVCSNCGVKGHLTHMQESFKVFGHCPVCQKELNWEIGIIEYTKEGKKEEIESE